MASLSGKFCVYHILVAKETENEQLSVPKKLGLNIALFFSETNVEG